MKMLRQVIATINFYFILFFLIRHKVIICDKNSPLNIIICKKYSNCIQVINLNKEYSYTKYRYLFLRHSDDKLYLVNGKYQINERMFYKLIAQSKSLMFKIYLKLKYGKIESFESITLNN